MNNSQSLSDIIASSKSIVFFGGAGVSTQSGIPDFRSAGGLYNSKACGNVSPETVLSHGFFMRHTAEFYDFYKSKMLYPNAKPNDAHLALVELERQGKLTAVITQNIDGLHQAAGSKAVYELHGSVLRNFCMDCGEAYAIDAVIQSDGIPRCRKCGGIIKPDVVLYDEALDNEVWSQAARKAANADTLIVGGTSLAVYPAANIVNYFNGGKIVLINMSETPFDKKADLVIHEPIGEVMKKAVL